MEITKIDATHILVFCRAEELSAPPAQLDSSVAAGLCRTAVARAGLSPSKRLKISAYIQENGLLLFTELLDEPLALYRFSSLENIIGAAHTLAQVCTPPSTLLYENETFYLAVFAQESATASQKLCQLGNALPNAAQKYAALQKQATILFPKNAVASLAKWFHR